MKIMSYSEVILLDISLILRCILIGIKYASFSKEKWSLLHHEYIFIDKRRSDYILKDWRE